MFHFPQQLMPALLSWRIHVIAYQLMFMHWPVITSNWWSWSMNMIFQTSFQVDIWSGSSQVEDTLRVQPWNNIFGWWRCTSGVVKKDYVQTLKQYCHCYCRCKLVPVAASALSALCSGWKPGSGVPCAIPGLIGLPSWTVTVIMMSASLTWTAFCGDSTQWVTCVLDASSPTLLCHLFMQLNWRETEHYYNYIHLYSPSRW